MAVFACPCISLPTLGKIRCQDRSGYCENDCRHSLSAEGGNSCKSVCWFTETRAGWGSMQGMLHQEEESYTDEAVLLQQSAVSARYFPFCTLPEATGQERFWMNSGCTQGEGNRRIQRKMPQILWRQFNCGCCSNLETRTAAGAEKYINVAKSTEGGCWCVIFLLGAI